MGFKEFLQKIGKTLVTPKQNEQGKKITPEEMELNSYYEQERRDRLRALVSEKRKQHNQMFNYKSSYNYNKGVQPSFKQSKKPSNNLYIKTVKTKDKSLFFH